MRTILPLLLASFAVAAPLSAQGAQYRIRLYEPWSLRLAPQVRATLSGLRSDSLPLPTKQGTTMMVPRRDVMRIDSLVRVVPRGARVRHSMVTGAIVGAIGGLALGYLTYQESAHGSLDSRSANTLAGGVLVAGFGTLLGAVLGTTSSGEEWRQVWPAH